MARNNGKSWTKTEISKLENLAKKQYTTTHIAKELGRTKDAIYTKASLEGITLKPKDK